MVPKIQLNINIIVFTLSILVVQAASTHKHEKLNSKERLKDGIYARNANHNEGGHHVEFDHEAILGSVREAEEFDTLNEEEAKRRLGLLVIKMDLNNDGFVDRPELKAWIIRSFKKLSEEEANDNFDLADTDSNEVLTWEEYLLNTYDTDNETSVSSEEIYSLENDKMFFFGADFNKDGKLTREEYTLFQNPEESPEMAPLVLKQTLNDRDTNKDGKIDFKEFVGGEAVDQDKEWLLEERTRYEAADKDKDGFLTGDEIISWAVPNQEQIALEEVDHLFAISDEDHDLRLSYLEIINNHETFVGSEATDFGEQLENMEHDEL
ncbi:reticulocalbin-2 [Condylostylus longicornis]|uniref:reticulocalbin-2 n=1 Tax=Condylostylus longicornis TaxID=2530218 RepID=UPI00244DBB28|nr:reticulocalbin-2 [Condylostylus longicornis]